jgi:glycosyltransferase involved in cell wall biosynthesis
LNRRPLALVLDGAGRAGTERHVLGLVHAFTALNWPLVLVTSGPGPLADEAVARGARWHLCPRPDAGAYQAALVRILRRECPDLVHTHSGRLAVFAARRAGIPAIVDTRHGLPETVRAAYLRHPGWCRAEGWKSRLADRTICVSEADAAWMEQSAGLPHRYLRVVRNGVPTPETGRDERQRAARAALGLPPDVPLVLFLGRLAEQKAPGRLLEHLASLRAGWDRLGHLHAGPDRPAAAAPGPRDAAERGRVLPELVICGEGPLEGPLRAAERELGLEGAIHWVGEVADAGPWLDAADLLALTSTWEGLPYVLLEALAHETPVLAYPVGGIPEVLTGDLAGSLVTLPGAWDEAAARFLRDREVRARWQAAARGRIRDFTEEATVAGVAAVYRELGWPG